MAPWELSSSCGEVGRLGEETASRGSHAAGAHSWNHVVAPGDTDGFLGAWSCPSWFLRDNRNTPSPHPDFTTCN